jgi:2-oxoglutarate dehydrogenase E2 component (dihydrolipoamide succinyltransferase)
MCGALAIQNKKKEVFMAVELKVPKVGESIVEVEIGEWLKQEGDAVALDETIVMLDSAKTTVELPAPVAGVLGRIVKNTGEAAAIGEVIALIEEAGATTSSSAAPNATTASAAPNAATASAAPAAGAAPEIAAPVQGEAKIENSATQSNEAADATANGEHAGNGAASRVMPAAQRVLAQNNIDAQAVQASGPGNRVLKEDAMRHLEGKAQNTPADSSVKEGAIEPSPIDRPAPSQPDGKAAQDIKQPREQMTPQSSTPQAAPSSEPNRQSSTEDQQLEQVVPMNMLRRHVAARLVEAQQNAALLTTFNEIDMTNVMALRKEHQEAFVKRYGIKLGFMSFFVKASIDALKQTPGVNAEIRGRDIVYRNYYDIGVAIGGGKGLVVPVLRRAERMSFADVEKGIADYAARVKDGKITPDELAGGTFTITNGGIYGSLLSTPIVNAPQSGILGMHAIQERPIALNGEVVIRPMMYVALTYDHRIVDGREAVTFLVRIKECIENPSRMLIEV